MPPDAHLPTSKPSPSSTPPIDWAEPLNLSQTPAMLPTWERQRKRRRWIILGVLASLLLCIVTCSVVIIFSLIPSTPLLPVTVMVGEQAYQTETYAVTVNDLLRELALTINDGDTVSPIPDAAITAGMVVRIARARDVTLVVDDESRSIRTLFTNPIDILNEAGLTVGDQDRIWVDGTAAAMVDMLVWPVPVTQISIRHAVTVLINQDGQESSIKTASETVGEALFDANVTLYLADTITPELNTAITADMRISIRRSSPISIVADGITLETRAQGSTVGDGLTGAGVVLMGLDYSIPAEDNPLQPGIVIRVIRVTEQVIQEQETIPFETIYQGDATLELDQITTAQEGQNGIQKINFRVRYENGIEVARGEESRSLAVEPINRVIAFGTNIVLRTIDTPEGPREYWRRIRVYATSYHPAALGGDNITATGRVLTKGIVGIDPTVIPYGTQLFVPGYGIGVAADTGGPRSTRLWIDLGYDDENWVSWSKPVDIYLLTPVPTEIDYILPD